MNRHGWLRDAATITVVSLTTLGKISIICGGIKEELDRMEWSLAVTDEITATCGHGYFLHTSIVRSNFFEDYKLSCDTNIFSNTFFQNVHLERFINRNINIFTSLFSFVKMSLKIKWCIAMFRRIQIIKKINYWN